MRKIQVAGRVGLQPRVPGVTRMPAFASLLPEVRVGLLAIARKERRSVSWVIAEVISDYFGLTVTGETRTVRLPRVRVRSVPVPVPVMRVKRMRRSRHG